MLAGLFVSVEDALTLDLPLQDEEYLPVSLLERGNPLATSKPSHEGSMEHDAKQADQTSGLSSLLNRRRSRRQSKVTWHLWGLTSMMAALHVANPPPLHPTLTSMMAALHVANPPLLHPTLFLSKGSCLQYRPKTGAPHLGLVLS